MYYIFFVVEVKLKKKNLTCQLSLLELFILISFMHASWLLFKNDYFSFSFYLYKV